MIAFDTLRLPREAPETAPDGSDVRPLLSLPSGSMAHFELAAGMTSSAVTHRTVDEIWFIVAGRGEMWRRQGTREETIALEPGVCLSIPLGTRFQFRASPDQPVSAVAVTLPAWPGDGEALPIEGVWTPSGD